MRKSTLETIVYNLIKDLIKKEDINNGNTIIDWSLTTLYNNIEKLANNENILGKTISKKSLKKSFNSLVDNGQLNDLFNIEKNNDFGKGQSFMEFFDSDKELNKNKISYKLSILTDGQLQEIKELIVKKLVIRSERQHGQLGAVVESISKENLLNWINEKGGIEHFKNELIGGKSEFDTFKDFQKITNLDKSVDLLMEAALSGKPTLIIRDYDNDGVTIGAAFDLLLKELDDLGIPHKIRVSQTIGGDIRGIDSLHDIRYFENLKEEFPNEDLGYLFTVDNGVSNGAEIIEIMNKMEYKTPPRINIVDHHSKDSHIEIEDTKNYFHTNPDPSVNKTVDAPKVAAGALAAYICSNTLNKIKESKDVKIDIKVDEHFDKIAEFGNQVDMVSCDIEHLHNTNEKQKRAGEIGALLNTYVKYEMWLRNPNILLENLKNISKDNADSFFTRFSSISEKAKIILNSKDESAGEINTKLIIEKSNPTMNAIDPETISNLRQFVVLNTYSTDPKVTEKATLALAIFKELKELDKDIVKEVRKDKDKYIELEHQELDVKSGASSYLRIYKEGNTIPTKLIDAAFPKPTTSFTASLTMKEIKNGSISYGGGFRSNIPGGHSNFTSEINNEINKINFLGHHNAAGIRGKCKGQSSESFKSTMIAMVREANKKASKISEVTTNEQIIEVDEDSIYQISLLSELNSVFESHMFSLKTGFKMAIKGSILNKQMKQIKDSVSWAPIPLTFGGNVMIAPNKEYDEDSYVIFNSLPGNSWITDGNTTSASKVQSISGIYDQQLKEIELRSKDMYNPKKPLVIEKMDSKAQEHLFANQGKYAEKNFNRTRGFIIQQMLNQNTQISIIYDIETTGSTKGAELGDAGKDKISIKGKQASEVINGQFVIRNIIGGKEIKSDSFSERLFFLEDGTQVLLDRTALLDLENKISLGELEIMIDNGVRKLPSSFEKEKRYEEIFSMEENENMITYNQELNIELADFLIDIENELPFTTVDLTHISQRTLTDYGHSAEATNKAIVEKFTELEDKLEDGKKISISAHNIGFDAGMSPQTLHFYQDMIVNNEKYIEIDTTHTVIKTEEKSVYFAKFSCDGFETTLQGFENGETKLFNPNYVLEDWLNKKEPSQFINLISRDERFEYKSNGDLLELYYVNVKSGKEELIMNDVSDYSEEDFSKLIKYDTSKKPKYSMQKLLYLITLDGVLFEGLNNKELTLPIDNNLFKHITDKKIKDISEKYLGSYVFTQSLKENTNMLLETAIHHNSQEKSVSMLIKLTNIENFLDLNDVESFFTKAGWKTYQKNLEENSYNKVESFDKSQLKSIGRDKLMELYEISKKEISEYFKDFLSKNKEMAELYELKVVAHNILPNVVNMPWPLKTDSQVEEWVNLLTIETGIEKNTIFKIVDLLNKKAIILGENPFNVEPHANIGLISDAAEEGFIIPLYKVMYSTNKPLNRSNLKNHQLYLESLEILKSNKARCNSNFTRLNESIYSKKYKKLRSGVLDDSLLTAGEKLYLCEKTDISDDEYIEINKTIEQYYSIVAYENTLNSNKHSLEKLLEIGTYQKLFSFNKTNNLMEIDSKELAQLELSIEKEEKDIEEGKARDILIKNIDKIKEYKTLETIINNLQNTKQTLEDKIDKDNDKYEVKITKKAGLQRDLMTNTMKFLEYKLTKSYYPIELEKKYETIMDIDNEIELDIDIENNEFVKETWKAIKFNCEKVIECDEKLKLQKETVLIDMKKYFDSRIELKLKKNSLTELLDENYYGKTFNKAVQHYQNSKCNTIINDKTIVLEENNTKSKRRNEKHIQTYSTSVK